MVVVVTVEVEMVGGGTAAWNVVAIEWYQTNGLASPHPWKARDSRKALRVCPPTAVNSTSHLPSTTGRARRPPLERCGYRVVPGEPARPKRQPHGVGFRKSRCLGASELLSQ